MSLSAHFRKQAEACEALGSPFTARLLRLLAERMAPVRAVETRLFGWPASQMKADAVALRLAGALHALVLMGRDEGLCAVYPPHQASEEALWRAVDTALAAHEAHILHWLDNAPQTNEVRRSAALILGASVAADHFPGLPLRVSELGASAGLNLNFDRFGLTLPEGSIGPENPALTLAPDWQGTPPPLAPFEIAERRGVDLRPVDPSDPDQLLRLKSYIWADQPDRMARTEAALSLPPAPVDAGDAGDWLTGRLADPVPGRIDFLYHTIAWQYFPEDTVRACRAAIDRAATRATPQAPFAWLSFEMDDQRPGAPVVLRLWPGDIVLPLGRMDFHGRWFHCA
ncbi:DUF2332 domain-containing protein [Thalassovita mangrovi]|uniref:DUF2332 family protein n=1 Tax=Thalassovita mangrovi TaxID=2692236 RepID=A0A6L8LMA5_9RHOB|nr:DUF2332 family protein [Thalassovita mangrovi]